MIGEPEREFFAELETLPPPPRRISIAGDRPRLHRRGAAADRALDAVLDHEVEPAWIGADDRLPALDRSVDRTRNEGQFLQAIAAVRNLGRQGVVLAFMRK